VNKVFYRLSVVAKVVAANYVITKSQSPKKARNLS